MAKSRTRVLVCDEERSSFFLVRDMLQATPQMVFHIEWASTYDDCYHGLRDNRYDVYLVDNELSDPGTEALLKETRVRQRPVPVLLMITYGTLDIENTVEPMGAMDYIEKSRLTPSLLERTIRYAIRRKRAEVEQLRLARQVRELQQLNADVIHLSAHDLGTPLTSIIGYTDMLLGDELNEEQRNYLSEVKTASMEIKKISQNMLALERIQALSQSQFEVVDLRDIVNEAVDGVRSQLQQSGHQLDLHITDEPLMIQGEVEQLREGVASLLDNALRYSPQDAPIHVELKADAESAIMTVVDHGPGIPEEEQDRVFSPFFQGSMSSNNGHSGQGLGLYALRTTINRHSGELIFDSQPNQETTFGFMIPLLEE